MSEGNATLPVTMNGTSGASDRGEIMTVTGLTLLCLLLGAGIPAVVSSALLMTLLVQATINAVFATSIGLLIRLNGNISFGQAAFLGLSVYIVALGFTRTDTSPELIILLALVVPTLVAFLLGLGIVRIPGIAFSMLTLAIGQAAYEFALKARWLTGGDDGFSIEYPERLLGLTSLVFQRPHSMFVISWFVLVITILGAYLLLRSQFGRIAVAIRENEERAQFIGYETRTRRAIAFAVTGFVAAVAGVLTILYSAYASPEYTHWSFSGSALIMAILGGPRLLWGPALGAIIFFFFKDIVGRYTEYWQAIIGITLILVTVMLPQGIGGFLMQLAARLSMSGRG